MSFVRNPERWYPKNLNSQEWEKTIPDGFSEYSRGKLPCRILEKECQICHKKFPVVGRWLETERYNLPETAVYRQLLSDTPCVALGWVKLDTGKEKPEPSPELRKRWQGIMWNVYRVAFLDVREGEVGQFCPSSSWGKGDPLPELDSMESNLERLLFEARKKGAIPNDESSIKTEHALGLSNKSRLK